jgi:hypothetical protein
VQFKKDRDAALLQEQVSTTCAAGSSNAPIYFEGCTYLQFMSSLSNQFMPFKKDRDAALVQEQVSITTLL